MRPAGLGRVDAAAHLLGRGDGLLADLGDDVAGAHALGVGVGAVVDGGDDEARRVVGSRAKAAAARR